MSTDYHRSSNRSHNSLNAKYDRIIGKVAPRSETSRTADWIQKAAPDKEGDIFKILGVDKEKFESEQGWKGPGLSSSRPTKLSQALQPPLPEWLRNGPRPKSVKELIERSTLARPKAQLVSHSQTPPAQYFPSHASFGDVSQSVFPFPPGPSQQAGSEQHARYPAYFAALSPTAAYMDGGSTHQPFRSILRGPGYQQRHDVSQYHYSRTHLPLRSSYQPLPDHPGLTHDRPTQFPAQLYSTNPLNQLPFTQHRVRFRPSPPQIFYSPAESTRSNSADISVPFGRSTPYQPQVLTQPIHQANMPVVSQEADQNLTTPTSHVRVNVPQPILPALADKPLEFGYPDQPQSSWSWQQPSAVQVAPYQVRPPSRAVQPPPQHSAFPRDNPVPNQPRAVPSQLLDAHQQLLALRDAQKKGKKERFQVVHGHSLNKKVVRVLETMAATEEHDELDLLDPGRDRSGDWDMRDTTHPVPQAEHQRASQPVPLDVRLGYRHRNYVLEGATSASSTTYDTDCYSNTSLSTSDDAYIPSSSPSLNSKKARRHQDQKRKKTHYSSSSSHRRVRRRFSARSHESSSASRRRNPRWTSTSSSYRPTSSDESHDSYDTGDSVETSPYLPPKNVKALSSIEKNVTLPAFCPNENTKLKNDKVFRAPKAKTENFVHANAPKGWKRKLAPVVYIPTKKTDNDDDDPMDDIEVFSDDQVDHKLNEEELEMEVDVEDIDNDPHHDGQRMRATSIGPGIRGEKRLLSPVIEEDEEDQEEEEGPNSEKIPKIDAGQGTMAGSRNEHVLMIEVKEKDEGGFGPDCFDREGGELDFTIWRDPF
ncbi:hypothetical protein IAR55_004102 [Kwoniella newhampshirensis]|uniref:Uncharacterized protein n=1 Tax=Kwoniella newhampshirensis TaxID=1651941 RepID=A0AAW0YLQ2_9TREE